MLHQCFSNFNVNKNYLSILLKSPDVPTEGRFQLNRSKMGPESLKADVSTLELADPGSNQGTQRDPGLGFKCLNVWGSSGEQRLSMGSRWGSLHSPPSAGCRAAPGLPSLQPLTPSGLSK